MMLIGRSSRRENLLCVTGVEPMHLIRTHLANHIRASSREEWLHQQARHMTAPTAIVTTPTQHLTQGRRPHMTQGAPSTHDARSAVHTRPFLRVNDLASLHCELANQSCERRAPSFAQRGIVQTIDHPTTGRPKRCGAKVDGSLHASRPNPNESTVGNCLAVPSVFPPISLLT